MEFIPENIQEGVLYISLEYCTSIHKCVCGCGNEVVTPISPTDWKLTFNGKSVSLYPSVGNWSFDCQSHYWITNNRIEFAGRWTRDKIEKGRENDLALKDQYFSAEVKETAEKPQPAKRTFWDKIVIFFS